MNKDNSKIKIRTKTKTKKLKVGSIIFYKDPAYENSYTMEIVEISGKFIEASTLVFYNEPNQFTRIYKKPEPTKWTFHEDVHSAFMTVLF